MVCQRSVGSVEASQSDARMLVKTQKTRQCQGSLLWKRKRTGNWTRGHPCHTVTDNLIASCPLCVRQRCKMMDWFTWWWNLHVSQAHDMQQQQQDCLWWDSEAKSNGVERFEKNAAQKLGKCSAGKIASCSSRGPESSSQHSLKFRVNLPEPQHYRCQTRDVRNITLTPSKWKPACLTKKKLLQESRNRQPVRLNSQSIHYLDNWNLDTRKQRNDTFLNVSKI